jgi:predicted nucleic acid-binding protein
MMSVDTSVLVKLIVEEQERVTLSEWLSLKS